jgi:uncharacterized Zn-binding protein involved in type VI secretion
MVSNRDSNCLKLSAMIAGFPSLVMIAGSDAKSSGHFGSCCCASLIVRYFHIFAGVKFYTYYSMVNPAQYLR